MLEKRVVFIKLVHTLVVMKTDNKMMKTVKIFIFMVHFYLNRDFYTFLEENMKTLLACAKASLPP